MLVNLIEHVSIFSSSRFCVATTFYGIGFNITGFGLNIYLTQFTYALIEIPAKVTVYYLLDKIGRRSVTMGALLMVAVCLGINIVVPKGWHTLRSLFKSLKLLHFK